MTTPHGVVNGTESTGIGLTKEELAAVVLRVEREIILGDS